MASTDPPRRSTRLAVASKAAAIAPKLDIPAPGPRAHSPSVKARGKAAFQQKQFADKEATGNSRVTRGQAKLEEQRVHTPEITVESHAPKASLASGDVRRAHVQNLLSQLHQIRPWSHKGHALCNLRLKK